MSSSIDKQARLWLRQQLEGESAVPDPADIANRFGSVLANRFARTIPDVDRIVLEVVRELQGESQGAFDKFAWLTAVAAMPVRLTSLELRAAVVLFGATNTSSGFAWPSQKTMAVRMGVSDPRQVRTALAGLERKGLIARGRIADLPEEEREQMRRHGRGTFYVPKMPSPVEKVRRPEPEKLKQGKQAKRTEIVRSNRTAAVRSKRTPTVRLIREGTEREELRADARSPHTPTYDYNRDVESEETFTSALTVEREKRGRTA